MKTKVLFIMHRSPPIHGAAVVGDFIYHNKSINEHFNCKFITIKSSLSVGEIGKFSLKKIFFLISLYLNVIYHLIFFKPDKIYMTISVGGLAFARDFIMSILFKFFSIFYNINYYFHYHTKGVKDFTSFSLRNKMTSFLLANSNVILLGPSLIDDLNNVDSYKKILFLPNSAKSVVSHDDFKPYIETKFFKVDKLNFLYMAHMMEDKGYKDVLDLALKYKDFNYVFHFAGNWAEEGAQEYFFSFIELHNLESTVKYHGFVSGHDKCNLFKKCNLLLCPTKNDAFPLTILESLSGGVPVLSLNEGCIADMIKPGCGYAVSSVSEFNQNFDSVVLKLMNKETAYTCRAAYVNNYDDKNFENNLILLFTNT